MKMGIKKDKGITSDKNLRVCILYGMKMEIKNLRSHLAMENQMDHQLPGMQMAIKGKKVKIKKGINLVNGFTII